MHVPKFWRMRSQLYRLQGVRYENGQVGLQARTVDLLNDNENVSVEADTTESQQPAEQKRRIYAA